MDDTRPSVRLKPKVDAAKFRHGFPWVYADELVLDRRTKSLNPGSLAVLEDADRAPLGLVSVNTSSKLVARVLDRDPAAQIDGAWVRAKLAAAAALRETLYDAPFYRVVHAEADGMPGVVVDRFGDTAVFQPNAVWADTLRCDIAQGLVDTLGVTTVIMNGTGRTRKAEGLDEQRAGLVGAMPDAPIAVPMNGAVYFADLADGQKTGLFFDQRDNHAFAARFAQGADVLDIFSHVGGFGLAAMAAGARSVTCVDASQAALDLAAQGAAATRPDVPFATHQGDAFKFLETQVEDNNQRDLVICDPPAFAPSKQALGQGLRAYERAARLSAKLVRPGGTLVLCSCSHAATLDKFRSACVRGIGRAGRVAQLIHSGAAGPDHPSHLSLADGGYLKALFFRVQ